VHFEISHEVDAPLDVVELAVISPTLGDVLSAMLADCTPQKIERVDTLEHSIVGDKVHRVLRFHALAPFAILNHLPIPRDALRWDEMSNYSMKAHASTWEVAPKDEYRKYFEGRGTYRLEAAAGGRTVRTVVGDLEIRVKLLGKALEKLALGEVKRTYAAEADTLRRLATL
jgi:hypothetical protein